MTLVGTTIQDSSVEGIARRTLGVCSDCVCLVGSVLCTYGLWRIGLEPQGSVLCVGISVQLIFTVAGLAAMAIRVFVGNGFKGFRCVCSTHDDGFPLEIAADPVAWLVQRWLVSVPELLGTKVYLEHHLSRSLLLSSLQYTCESQSISVLSRFRDGDRVRETILRLWEIWPPYYLDNFCDTRCWRNRCRFVCYLLLGSAVSTNNKIIVRVSNSCLR